MYAQGLGRVDFSFSQRPVPATAWIFMGYRVRDWPQGRL